jgi:hypothetical protein
MAKSWFGCRSGGWWEDALVGRGWEILLWERFDVDLSDGDNGGGLVDF